MPKVILDAGHGGSDIGEYYERRSEKNDNLLLVLRIGKFLTEWGVEVAYTRTSDVYLPMMERVAIANQISGDILVSIHRLSGNSITSTPGLDFFVEEKDEFGEKVASNIGQSLYSSGFEYYGTIVRTDIPLISDTNMPAIMVGIGYLRSKKDNMNFDNKFVQIAEGIAEGIYQSLMNGGSVSTSDYRNSEYHYRIGVGPFPNYNAAMEQQLVLSSMGYETEIHKLLNFYYIYTQGFEDLDDAGVTELLFRRYGFHSFIVLA